MEKEQLLCCPFCGTKNAHIKQNGDHFFYIVCEKDGCYVRTDGYLNRQSAIDFWNKRSEENKI
jgi:hypothetical protein